MKVQLRTKNDLLAMGYPSNRDPDDFLNLMAGKIVTIDYEYNMESGEKIYISKEFPEHAIYDYLIKRFVNKNLVRSAINDFNCSFKEIGTLMGVSFQRIQQIHDNLFKENGKLEKIAHKVLNDQQLKDLIDTARYGE